MVEKQFDGYNFEVVQSGKPAKQRVEGHYWYYKYWFDETSGPIPSGLQIVRNYQAALYLIQGTADEQSTVTGFDMMRAELAAKGRKAVFERIEGADHSLKRQGESPGEGLEASFRRIADWFLAGTP